MPRVLHRLGSAAALGAALAIAGIGAGCNIVGPALYLVQGPPKTPAAYEIADRPTVVFVDDRDNILPRYELRATIGDEAATRLMEAKRVTRTFSSRDALNLTRKQETDTSLMPIDAIGRAVGAEQVIYVKIVAFTLSPDGFTPLPSAGAEVRLIDVVDRVKLFPEDGVEVGRYVEAQTREQNPDLYRSMSNRRALEEALAQELGVRIAKLFYEHETKELGSNLR